MPNQPKIICISNRLPVSVTKTSNTLEIRPSSGGLVTAMGPVLTKSQGIWIGWPGTDSSEDEEVRRTLGEFSEQSEFDLIPVLLDEDSVTGFYQGFSNQIIWPLFHDLQSRCNFDPTFWSAYQNVQEVYKDEALKHIDQNDLVWVHDFHLMGLGGALRNSGIKNKTCFFLHTPFPGPDIFSKLPWREEVIDSLLSYNLIGFQTKRDLNNFVDCVKSLTEYPCLNRGDSWFVNSSKVETIAGSFPISIDFSEFVEIARSPEVESKAINIKKDMNVDFLILSVDRLDYTKGIPYRIRAFNHLLEQDPSLKKRVVLLQVVVPSRIDVPEYQQLLQEIEQLVSKLNGEYGEPGWVPMQHLYRSLEREDLIAMYRASDVALVTPLKDGMNLVAKEYCASRINNRGALVLSEFAGVADELGDYSYLVNPYDIDKVAGALSKAFYEDKEKQLKNMACIRSILEKYDVYSWAHSFLDAVGWQWNSKDSGPRPSTIWDRLKRITKVLDV